MPADIGSPNAQFRRERVAGQTDHHLSLIQRPQSAHASGDDAKSFRCARPFIAQRSLAPEVGRVPTAAKRQ